MSVIDLSTRITTNWNEYQSNKCSSDSLIFISPDSYSLEDGPASVDFSVGKNWYIQNDNTMYSITKEGLTINPFQSVLIETEEELAVPHNIFGLVTGKGLQIFQGTFISTGKINPGFHNKLKIGIYNGSKRKIRLFQGNPLCTCVFFQMESNLQVTPKLKSDESLKISKPLGKRKQLVIWVKENKEFLAIIISILAFIASVSNLILNKNFIFYKTNI